MSIIISGDKVGSTKSDSKAKTEKKTATSEKNTKTDDKKSK